jgi:hypothetical protein
MTYPSKLAQLSLMTLKSGFQYRHPGQAGIGSPQKSIDGLPPCARVKQDFGGRSVKGKDFSLNPAALLDRAATRQ